MIMIGITGTNGAGKGAIVEYLVKNKGFKHYSFGGYIAKEIEKRNLKVDRNSLTVIGNELRKKNGSHYIAQELYKKARKLNQNSVLESIRNPKEVDFLKHKDNFTLIFIDAGSKIRFRRIKKRKSNKDNIDYGTFVKQEKKEIKNKNVYGQNLSAVFKMADYKIINNSSFSNLYSQIDQILIDITK